MPKRTGRFGFRKPIVPISSATGALNVMYRHKLMAISQQHSAGLGCLGK
jgi:hypothetical protein